MTAITTHHASEALGFWQPKRTLTLEAARRHSKNIHIIRRLLIALAGLLILTLIWQFSNKKTTYVPQDSAAESVRMINPRYTGRTDDGLPYYLTATEAIRMIGNDDLVDLIDPVLHFYREEGLKESTIVAETGRYDDVKKILNLRTKVDLKTDDGNHCITTHARIFAKAKTVEGDEPIKCTGSFGIVNGNTYEILENYSVFVFKSGMSAILDQDETALLPETNP